MKNRKIFAIIGVCIFLLSVFNLSAAGIKIVNTSNDDWIAITKPEFGETVKLPVIVESTASENVEYVQYYMWYYGGSYSYPEKLYDPPYRFELYLPPVLKSGDWIGLMATGFIKDGDGYRKVTSDEVYITITKSKPINKHLENIISKLSKINIPIINRLVNKYQKSNPLNQIIINNDGPQWIEIIKPRDGQRKAFPITLEAEASERVQTVSYLLESSCLNGQTKIVGNLKEPPYHYVLDASELPGIKTGDWLEIQAMGWGRYENGEQFTVLSRKITIEIKIKTRSTIFLHNLLEKNMFLGKLLSSSISLSTS